MRLRSSSHIAFILPLKFLLSRLSCRLPNCIVLKNTRQTDKNKHQISKQKKFHTQTIPCIKHSLSPLGCEMLITKSTHQYISVTISLYQIVCIFRQFPPPPPLPFSQDATGICCLRKLQCIHSKKGSLRFS